MPLSYDDRPAFAVLDIVMSLLPEERRAENVVYGVRRYVDGHHTFHVAPLDPADEVVGGIYAGSQLAATGRRADVSLLWTKPDWARRIVTVSEDYPTRNCEVGSASCETKSSPAMFTPLSS